MPKVGTVAVRELQEFFAAERRVMFFCFLTIKLPKVHSSIGPVAKHVTDFTKGLADLVEDTLKIFERFGMPIAPLSKAAWGSKYKYQCFLRWWGVLSLTLFKSCGI